VQVGHFAVVGLSFQVYHDTAESFEEVAYGGCGCDLGCVGGASYDASGLFEIRQTRLTKERVRRATRQFGSVDISKNVGGFDPHVCHIEHDGVPAKPWLDGLSGAADGGHGNGQHDEDSCRTSLQRYPDRLWHVPFCVSGTSWYAMRLGKVDPSGLVLAVTGREHLRMDGLG